MHLRTLLAVVVLALLPATAQAHTTIIEPPETERPYQDWVDHAYVPTPDVSITVIEVPDPCAVRWTAGCTDETSVIEIANNLPAPEARAAFFHELGHVFDRQVLTPTAREKVTALLHRSGDPWEPMVEESFADSYSWCARSRRFDPVRRYEVEQARVTGADLQRICRSIRSDIHTQAPTASSVRRSSRRR